MIVDVPLVNGSRRHRLWDLTQRYHCPVIGVCFKLGEIREMVLKVMTFPHRPTDYEVHCTAASECGARTPLSSLLHKTLEKKYALAIQRCKPLKTMEELAAKWREAVAGDDVPGMFWAVLTHPASTEEFRLQVYADIHMLQHQIGAGVRREQQAWTKLQEENAILGRELSRIQQRVTESCNRYIEQVADLKAQLDAARTEAVQQQALAERHAAERDSLREQSADTNEIMRLMYRLQLTEGAYATLKERHATLETEYSAAREDIRRLEFELEDLIEAKEPESNDASQEEQRLLGRTVLCVGGRVDAIPHFRSLVQLRGGEFMHHDGGKEENIGRLEAVISAADAVICQTGCISHNAYWRVKEQCKRTGKPCSFVGNPSLSSFLQVLDHLVDRKAESGEVEEQK
ncbi:MAG: DUF2325 domain-containing protein [Methylophilaceae bacterium]|jgi:hypothetical protein